MDKNKLLAIGLIVIILLPLGIWYFLRFGSVQVFNTLPHQYSIDHQTQDTLWHRLPEFSFTDQDGNEFGRKDMLGKIWIVSFFDSKERPYFPILLDQLHTAYTNIQDASCMRILSISMAPEYDSVSVLKHYTDSLEVKPDKWIFAVGSRDESRKLGLHTFRFKGFMQRIGEDKPFTARTIALVDGDGLVRNYYEGTNSFDVEKVLSQDLIALYHLEYKNNCAKDRN